jgi:hypothetical protein
LDPAALDVRPERGPADDAGAIDQDRRGARHVRAAGSAARVHETEPARDREIGVREESIVDVEAIGELLAPLVRIRAQREHLDAGGLQITRESSKALELGCAEGSPVAAIEN